MIQLFLLLTTLLFTYASTEKKSFFEIKAPKNGEIPLSVDVFGFYFLADLVQESSQAIKAQTRALIFPSLSSSQTLLVSDKCLSFVEYDCSKYECTPYPEEKTDITHQYFEGEGYHAELPLILDHSNWVLNNKAAIATSCSGFDFYGGNMHGVLGLGHEGNSGANFIGSQVFSIYLRQNGSEGTLLFHWNSSYAQSETPLVTLKSDENWHVNSINEITVGNGTLQVEDLELIFDLTGVGLGLPKAVFDQVLATLKEVYNINCTSHSFNPVCGYSGYIKGFPSLAFKTATGEKLVLPPQAYLQDGHNETIQGPNVTLSFRALSSELEELSYVTPSYDKTIIIGSQIMRNFYIKFDAANKAISVYDAKHFSSSSQFLNYVAIFLILAVAAVAICLILSGSKKKMRKESHPLMVNEEEQ